MHVVSREPTDVQRGDTECMVLNGAAPGLGTHLAEGRKAFCAGVQATIPFLGIQRESAWEGKSLHGEEGAVAWGREGPLFQEPVPTAGGRACHQPVFPSFPLALLRL